MSRPTDVSGTSTAAASYTTAPEQALPRQPVRRKNRSVGSVLLQVPWPTDCGTAHAAGHSYAVAISPFRAR
jgi:hypothetical protein